MFNQVVGPSILVLGLAASVASGQNRDSFDFNHLPKGANVTLPRSARTIVPLNTKVRFASTDAPQSLRFTPLGTSGGQAKSVRISIFTETMKPIKNIDVRPGASFLYSFEGLESIYITSEAIRSPAYSMKIQVESDKPLFIGY